MRKQKADKTDGATENNIVSFDSEGNIEDSGIDKSNVIEPSDILGQLGDIDVTDNGDGTVTLSVSDLLLAASVLGTANQITITDNADGTVTLSIASPTYLGSAANITAGNYAKFEEDGTLVFLGDAVVYDDQQVNISSVKLPASGAPSWGAFNGGQVLEFAAGADNVIYFVAQLSHKYKHGTDLEFHVHTSVPDDTAGVVRWIFTYSWADIANDFPSETTTTTEQTIALNSADAHLYKDIDAAVSSASGEGNVSGILLCSLTREGTHANDTYGDVIRLLAADFHFQIDTVGSREETSK